mmetsp:Transcript_29981/g.95806  ORF Transcript_29981/g.95806 Transcript_29981/m.95806 type:complete len:301 (-) Transcript_29981:239-1141(-)
MDTSCAMPMAVACESRRGMLSRICWRLPHGVHSRISMMLESAPMHAPMNITILGCRSVRRMAISRRMDLCLIEEVSSRHSMSLSAFSSSPTSVSMSFLTAAAVRRNSPFHTSACVPSPSLPKIFSSSVLTSHFSRLPHLMSSMECFDILLFVGVFVFAGSDTAGAGAGCCPALDRAVSSDLVDSDAPLSLKFVLICSGSKPSGVFDGEIKFSLPTGSPSWASGARLAGCGGGGRVNSRFWSAWRDESGVSRPSSSRRSKGCSLDGRAMVAGPRVGAESRLVDCSAVGVAAASSTHSASTR